MEFVEYAITRTSIADKLFANLADDVLDDVYINMTGAGACHISKSGKLKFEKMKWKLLKKYIGLIE